MKFSIALFAILSVTAVQAAPMKDCGTQADCLDFTVTEVSPGSTCSGDCDFEICMTVNQSKAGCVKSGSISHTCEKPSSGCTTTDGFSSVSATEGIGDGYTSCQTVTAGATAEFLMKDGNGTCESGSTALTGSSGTATCAALEDEYPTGGSCTGNVNKECIWMVQAPACSGSAPPITINTASEPEDSEYLCT
jgi:hypothetical protein